MFSSGQPAPDFQGRGGELVAAAGEFPADSERRRPVGLGLPASTLDSKIKALKIDKRRYQNP
jgi:hypothetical protein